MKDKYQVFISYTSKDQDWAEWLHKSFRWYCLPRAIRRRYKLPKQLWPTFLDKTHLNAGELETGIFTALNDSTRLVVICSQSTRAANWVDKEIEYFASLGKKDNIYPIAVSGNPYYRKSQEEKAKHAKENGQVAQPLTEDEINTNEQKNECLPREYMKLFPEVRSLPYINGRDKNEIEESKRREFIKLVSEMIKVDFSELWEPYKQALRRQKQLKYATITSGLVALLTGFTLYDYNRVKNDYFVNYVDKQGVPTGIGQLDDAAIEKRASHYRFEHTKRYFWESEGGKLNRIVYSNSSGMPINHHFFLHSDRPSIQVIRDAIIPDKPFDIEYYDSTGQLLCLMNIGGQRNSVDIKSPNGDLHRSLSSSVSGFSSNLFDSQSDSAKSRIRRYKLLRDSNNGFIVKKMFKANNGDDSTEAVDRDNIAGFEYKLDSLGRPIQIVYLNAKGEPAIGRNGIGVLSIQYDSKGDIKSYSCYDRAPDKGGELITNEYGWASSDIDRDEHGNPVKQSFRDSKGALSLTRYGYAVLHNVYDEHGQLICTSYKDVDGRTPTYDSQGRSTIKYEYGKNGYVNRESYYDRDGSAIYQKSGYAVRTFEYDKDSTPIKTSFFDIGGNPCLNNRGYHSIEYKYDSEKNVIQISFYDAKRNPIISKEGYASVRFKYQKNIQAPIEETLYNERGEPMYGKSKYVSSRMEYDNQGNLKSKKYYGLSHTNSADEKKSIDYTKLIYNAQHFNYAKVFYDEGGRIVKYEFFGDSGFAFHKNGYAKTEYFYKGAHHVLTTFYEDESTVSNLTNQRIAKIRFEYYSNGKLKSKAFFDKNDKVSANSKRIARISYKYDARGNVIEECYYSKNPSVLKTKVGYDIVKHSYDKQNNVTKSMYYNSKYEPVTLKDGYSGIAYTYDSKNNLLSKTFLDSNSQPTVNRKFNFSKVVNLYDRLNNRVQVRYYDANGKATLHRNNYSEIRVEYDSMSNLIQESYYDTNRESCLKNNLYATIKIKYDNRGKRVMESFYDQKGKRCNNKTYSIKKITRNALSEITSTSYFGTDGEPVIFEDGYSVEKMEYDALGNLIKAAAYDTKGKPIMRKSGFSFMIAKYDKRNNEIELRYFDSTGKPAALAGVISTQKMIYDENGKYIKSKMYKIDGTFIGETTIDYKKMYNAR